MTRQRTVRMPSGPPAIFDPNCGGPVVRRETLVQSRGVDNHVPHSYLSAARLASAWDPLEVETARPFREAKAPGRAVTDAAGLGSRPE